MALPTAATTRRLAATTLPHFRGFPTEYWWCWASIGFLLGTMAICIGLFVAACTYLGGERRCTGVGSCSVLKRWKVHTFCSKCSVVKDFGPAALLTHPANLWHLAPSLLLSMQPRPCGAC